MATVNALSVALFNAAAGGYAAEMTANASGFANAVGPILEKDISTDALFVEHLLGNLGVTSSMAVYAQAKAAVAGLVAAKGRAGAASDAVDFLKAQEGTTSAYATIAADFAAKVNKAAVFTAANATERDITKLVSAITGVDTDVLAINTAVAAQKAADDAAAAVAVAKAAADAKAAAEATAKAAADAAADAAATKAAADLAAAKAAADAAAAKAAADLKAANDQITALKNPAGSTSALTSSTDVLIGTAGNDTFTGTTANLSSSDIIVDANTSDNDTFTLNATASVSAFVVANVENINVNISSINGSNFTVDAGSFTGVTNLTASGTDVSVGGSIIAGDKDIIVSNVDASKIAKVTAGAGTKDASVTQATKAGATIELGNATGAIAVTGAGTVNANNATGNVVITKLNSATEDAKALVVNAASTGSLTTADTGFTGPITFNAAKASTITILNATGGVTVTGGSTSTADTTIRVDNIDDSGATITTGNGYKASALKNIAVNLDGTSDTTDAATIAATGYISVNAATTDLVESLTLSGNGADVTYAVSGAPTKYTLTGANSVTIEQTAANLAGKTLVDSTTAGTTTVAVSTTATADLSGIASDVIQVTDAAGATATLTVKTGALVEIDADQTNTLAFAGKTSSATVNLATGDDTGGDGTVADISLANLTASSNVKYLNINATAAKLTVGTATTLGTTSGSITTITGTKAVNLGTVGGGVTITSTSTGDVTIVTGSTNSTLKTITTGSGNDTVTTDYDAVYTVNLGDGDNALIIEASGAADGSSFATGSGSDSVTIKDASSVVIVTGEGDDTITVDSSIATTDSVIVMGGGTGDKLVFGAAIDQTAQTNFAVTGVEIVDITASNGEVKYTSTQFASDNTFRIDGDSATADIFHVINTSSTAGSTIDASGITFASTQAAKLVLEGNAFYDAITGSTKNDTFIATAGGDAISGGTGTDTYDASGLDGVTETGSTRASAGVVINLGTTAITNTAVLGNTGNYTANSVTSVAAGTVAYTFASSSTGNSGVTGTLSSIENVIGSDGADYIVGTTGNNVITGGVGADYINVGVGTDTIRFAATGDSGADTASGSATSISTLAFDVIVGMGTGDKLDFSALTGLTSSIGTGVVVDPVNNKITFVKGTYDASANSFTYSSSGADSLVVYDTATGATVTAEAVVLVGFVHASSTVTGGIVTLG